MGNILQFSSPRVSSAGTKLWVTARIPPYRDVAAKLWEVWRQNKPEIREDGFQLKPIEISTHKDWEIRYWHDIKPGDMDLTEEGVPAWKILFADKLAAWQVVYNETIAPVDDYQTKQRVDPEVMATPNLAPPREAKPAPKAAPKAAPKVAPKAAPAPTPKAKPAGAKPYAQVYAPPVRMSPGQLLAMYEE
jgi:hypothetical protein